MLVPPSFLLCALFITTSATMPRRRVLASDGIDASGRRMLEDAGFDVFPVWSTSPPAATTAITAEMLPGYDVLVVRSKTKVTRALLSHCAPGNSQNRLRLIARAGVGLDNIDLTAAADQRIAVVNTPNANARSVAELVFAHIFSLARSLHVCHREMPANADHQARALYRPFEESIAARALTLLSRMTRQADGAFAALKQECGNEV